MANLFLTWDILLLFAFADGNTQTFLEDVGLYTFYCPSLQEYKSTSIEFWLVQNNNEMSYYTCTSDKITCDNSIGFSATLNKSGSYFPIEMNKSEVRRITGLKCVFKNPDIEKNDTVLIVAKPQIIDCNEVLLSIDKKNVSITCRSTKAYPQAYCIFEMQNKVAGTTAYSNVNYSQSLEYYSTNCMWTSPLSNFAVGQYNYTVSFFPIGTNNSMSYGASLKQSIHFTLQTPHLSDECFKGLYIVNGYIKPGATVNCICYSENTGFPPPVVRWLNNDDQEVGADVNSTATSLTISLSNDTMTFSCMHSTYLKNGNVSVNYTPNFAMGPRSCTVEPDDTTTTIWNICNNEKIVNVSIVCSVYKSDVKPGIKSIISISTENSELLDSQVNNTSDSMYRARYEAVLAEAKNYSIRCQVQNSIFKDLQTNCTFAKPLQVHAPPELLPRVHITDINKENVGLNVQENQPYFLECTSFGGVPPVSNVTVSCGNITESTQSGNIFTSSVTFTRNMTGQNCTCTAQHITGCYTRNLYQQQMHILYSPIVTDFTQSAQYVENGDSSELICIADGNPPPLMNISKGLTLLNQTYSGGYILSFKRTMTCRDTGKYMCQAHNGIYNRELQENQEKYLMIYVKCMLQFDRPVNLTTEFSNVKGDSFSYGFIIYGYPLPSNITFSKLDKTDSSLSISYSSSEPPYTYVTLKISKLTASDFSNYTVNIFQNESHSLNYTFNIKEVNQTNQPMEDFPLAAAIGGGIAAGCFVVLLVVILAYLVKNGLCHQPKEFRKYVNLAPGHESKITGHTKKKRRRNESAVDNSDIYFLNVRIKEKLKTLKKPESETYKNYQDIVQTITTATAAPKNFYKPEVKSKPKVKNDTDYYNFVEPKTPSGLDVSDKKQLLDENVYANQGFNIN